MGRQRTPLVLQAERDECGLACLAMVAGCHGGTEDLASLRRRAGGGRVLKVRDLLALAGMLGLESRAVRLEPSQFDQLRLPAMLHWDMDHWVVLARRGRRLQILDPALGRRRLTAAALSRHFTGVAIELWTTRPLPRAPRRPRLRLRDLPGLGRHHLTRLGTLAALSLLLQLLVLAGPLQVQWIIDEGLATGAADVVALICLGFALVLALRVLVELVRAWWVVCYGNLLGWDLDRALMQRLLARPLAWFQHRQTADLLSRYGSLRPVQQFLSEGVAGALVDGIVVLLSLALLAVYAPGLALLVLAAVLLYALVNGLCFPLLRERSLEEIAAGASEQAVLLESLRTLPTIRSWGLEGLRHELWQVRRSATLNAVARSARLGVGLRGFNLALFGVEHLLVIYLLAGRVLDGAMSLGMFYAFLSFKDLFAGRAAALVDRAMQFATLRVHLERLRELVGTAGDGREAPPRAGRDAPAPVELRPADDADAATASAELVLEAVSFRYGRFEPWLLERQSLRLCDGQLALLLGPSGSGKSTLLQLLQGQREPDHGRVLLGGRPVSGGWPRGWLATVLQSDVLFSASLRDNVTLYDGAAADEAVLRALEQAAALPLVAQLPAGLATPLGERGAGLSGGQQQRILLARAFYRRPRVLLLDEGTAHLDPAAAGRVLEALLELDATRLVISHDQTLALHADRVLWLENGRLQDVTERIAERRQAAC